MILLKLFLVLSLVSGSELRVSRVFGEALDNLPEGYSEYKNLQIDWKDPGRYTILRNLGSGVYSEVYKALDVVSGEYVCIKYLRPISLRRIMKEIHILQNLKSGPSILPLFSAIRDPVTKQVGLVTKWVNSKESYRGIKEMNDLQFREYIYKLLKGLSFAHQMGIIHRDIKPDNILVDRLSKDLFIVDWGLAEYYVPLRPMSTDVATRPYRGPELYTNDDTYDFTLDIWSVACIIAGKIFNMEPFMIGETNDEQLEAIGSVLGTEDLNKYIIKYNLHVDDEIFKHLKPHYRRPWSDFFPENPKFINNDVLDLLNHTLMYDREYRYSANECLKHPWFNPIRDQVEAEIESHFPLENLNFEISHFLMEVRELETLLWKIMESDYKTRHYRYMSDIGQLLGYIETLRKNVRNAPTLETMVQAAIELEKLQKQSEDIESSRKAAKEAEKAEEKYRKEARSEVSRKLEEQDTQWLQEQQAIWEEVDRVAKQVTIDEEQAAKYARAVAIANENNREYEAKQKERAQKRKPKRIPRNENAVKPRAGDLFKEMASRSKAKHAAVDNLTQ